jgi:TM2 domain-containing membrane protein YozV
MNTSLFGATGQTGDAAGSQSRSRWKKPLLAFLLSLLSDGLGQVYNGELIKGLAFAFAGLILA